VEVQSTATSTDGKVECLQGGKNPTFFDFEDMRQFEQRSKEPNFCSCLLLYPLTCDFTVHSDSHDGTILGFGLISTKLGTPSYSAGMIQRTSTE
jgi:hypothetical protein